jgi:hypothetical protein
MADNTVLLFDVLERTIDNRGKTPPFSETGYPLVEVKHIQSGRLYPVLMKRSLLIKPHGTPGFADT